MKKATVIETLERLPNEFSTEELLERLLFIEKIEQGLKESDKNATLSLEEVKAKLAEKWSK